MNLIKKIAEFELVEIHSDYIVLIGADGPMRIYAGNKIAVDHRVNLGGPKGIVATLRDALEYIGFHEDRTLQ